VSARVDPLPSIALRNPRTGEFEGQLPADDGPALARRADALRAAQPAWAAAGVERRCRALLDFADAILAQREPIARAVCADTGRWHESALEVDSVVATLRRWAADAPAQLAEPAPQAAGPPHLEARQTLVPHRLVGVISPWNFPLLLSLIDAIPALAAGCAVLVKPSEVTPRFVAPLRVALDAVPGLAAVLDFALGAGPTGAALVDVVDLVCFTGSVRTGRAVGEACARRFIPAFLELGGKDPAIVLEDADVGHAARALAWSGFVNAGQSCMSIERVYVVDAVADRFIEALVREASALKFAWPRPEDGPIGPIISAAQARIVEEHLAEALARGARALTGGQVVELGGGRWCPPTVLVDVADDLRVMQEETFAAILPVVRVRDADEAVRRANDSHYGLSAAVFAGDVERAAAVARRLEAGAVSINDASLTAIVHTAEKQSFKLSGLGGSRMGKASIRRFVRQRALLVNAGAPSPWWFPPAGPG
jgi:acyl-CoA reductase-like NAD-dependent aldehyde dehydrogenase